MGGLFIDLVIGTYVSSIMIDKKNFVYILKKENYTLVLL